MKNLLTVDVEDYFQVTAFDDVVPRASWPSMERRVERNTEKAIEILNGGEARATFFVLGWVAERCPSLVSGIAEAGHEVASHGYGHEMVDRLGRDGFREDVRRSKAVLEDIVSAPVRGYRAPTFSITPKTPWAWETLAEEGFEYDSSTFPVHHDRYGNPNGIRHVHRRGEAQGGIVEFPLTTLRVAGINIPAAGGGYLRLFPTAVIRAAVRRSNRAGFPAVLYFHPWELDPDQPRMPAGRMRCFRHYVNLRKTEARLRSLLAFTEFESVGDYLDRDGPVPAGLPVPGGKERSRGKAEPRPSESPSRSPGR